ncbi:hypothetical protein HK405_013071 [Cladochytrium tenue]|nr:hypothetical protein HK405_013071 [Cladochytrium tenue]
MTMPKPSSAHVSLVARALHVERVPLPPASATSLAGAPAASSIAADAGDFSAPPHGANELFRCGESQLWKPTGARGVYGGQIIGLALSAANKTVPPAFLVHVRRAFATRHVEAVQNGRRIFVMTCSFQIPAEKSLTYQVRQFGFAISLAAPLPVPTRPV